MLANDPSPLARSNALVMGVGRPLPIVLTSRADSVRARMASCAVAVLYADARGKAAAVPAASLSR